VRVTKSHRQTNPFSEEKGVDYNHDRNRHTLEGSQAALPEIFADWKPASLLDVGCGTGTWLKAALESGIQDVFGLDGVAIPAKELLIPLPCFRQQDLTLPWNLGRRFDAVLCLEVAEHIEGRFGAMLVEALTRHADVVVFSAAIPGQPGQHHVNCQWPAYWQKRFNAQGFACDDAVRWRVWDDERIEPWYRKNLFVARRNPATAGQEARLRPVIHPELLPKLFGADRRRFRVEIESGGLSTRWYWRTPFVASWAKLKARKAKQATPAHLPS